MAKLAVSLDHIAVRFDDRISHSRRRGTAKDSRLGSPQARVELPGEKFTIYKVAPVALPRPKRHKEAVSAAAAHPDVTRVGNVYGTARARVVATDRVIVRFVAGANPLPRVLRKFRAEVLDGEDGEYLLRIHPNLDPLEISGELARRDDVAFAEPDFVTVGERVVHANAPDKRSSRPNLYPLRITRAREAWRLCRGDPRVRIAILDEGVQTTHASLRAAIVGTYDATHRRAQQDPEECDWHGTACAGLAAGRHAPGGSLLGIGAGCSILAVRMGYTVRTGAGSDERRYVTKSWWIKRAIDWAWRNGADVISNSWSGGTSSALVAAAFERARTEGRGGKGCVIVVSAGNDNGPVEFPGTTKGALTVAATNQFDEPKTPQSRDNQRWWGSNYGPDVDLAAPGVQTFTTDNVGRTRGAPRGYCSDFSGTSASAPIVAGAAALVLSANPNLSGAEVCRILCDTADKPGVFDYYDGRNDRLGHGRLNVLTAVRAALAAKEPKGKQRVARKRR